MYRLLRLYVNTPQAQRIMLLPNLHLTEQKGLLEKLQEKGNSLLTLFHLFDAHFHSVLAATVTLIPGGQ